VSKEEWRRARASSPSAALSHGIPGNLPLPALNAMDLTAAAARAADEAHGGEALQALDPLVVLRSF